MRPMRTIGIGSIEAARQGVGSGSQAYLTKRGVAPDTSAFSVRHGCRPLFVGLVHVVVFRARHLQRTDQAFTHS